MRSETLTRARSRTESAGLGSRAQGVKRARRNSRLVLERARGVRRTEIAGLEKGAWARARSRKIREV